MGNIDPLKTQRSAIPDVAAELSGAGFAEAEEVGRGGFGVVYRCAQLALDRKVAVKVLTADIEEANRQRFLREQRAMGRLTGHPNIVGVLQVGTTTSGLPYLVMPYYPQDSLDSRIRRHGPLSVKEALRLGVKLAGAVATAHRLDILHRDIKPGNILITDYGEPALTDFGIARIPGGYRTSTDTITGSPAFTAPEVLAGEEPTRAADVYGLGATLFAALTGHAAFERRGGEHVVAQFVRIAAQPTPNLCDHGIDEDLSMVIEHAMARIPGQRPAPITLGEQLQQLQFRRGLPVDEMAVQVNSTAEPQASTSVSFVPSLHAGPPRSRPLPFCASLGREGTLPLELTSFVGRRTEVAEAKSLLASSRLVTMTGIGGVGKTRLALRVAASVKTKFSEGVQLIELGQLRDSALLPEVIADAVGLCTRRQPLLDALIEYLASRQMMLVLDNCEHIVDAAAKVAETLLRTCPGLRILATSREPLSIGGEAVLRVRPMIVPGSDRQLSLRGAPRYDGVTLFAERAAAALPGFALTEDNIATVTEICRRVDGLPLAIELAAARLQTLSAEQILQRLTDRYALLTQGSRTAPSRQQTLRWCIDWSYSLCSPACQRVWAQLSAFAGSFELDAAEGVCRSDSGEVDLLDVLTALVAKSILIREESGSGSIVRFRLLETLRDYGRERIEESGEYFEVRRRHADWYRKLAEHAEADWGSPRQLDWIARLHREQSNLREALDFCLSDTQSEAGAALSFAAALQLFWTSRGQTTETQYWLARALAGRSSADTAARAKALWRASLTALIQDDSHTVSTLAAQAQALADRTEHPPVHAFVNLTRSLHALRSGTPDRALAPAEAALNAFAAHGDLYGQFWALHSLGWAHELQGDSAAALKYHEKTLSITESHGDSVHRSYALWATAVAVWRQGDGDRAQALLQQELQLIRELDDPYMGAWTLETLAWIVGAEGGTRRAALLLGAATRFFRATGTSAGLFPTWSVHHHEECERAARRALGDAKFEAAFREGVSLDLDAAIGNALGEKSRPAATNPAELTTREREVADLVAQGITNRAIATRLNISVRTVGGHVEHILTKLGFTSRTQIAAWVTERSRHN
ncbi:non-specific serine/threonine protein kinase [Nocardia kruczakiae]|uniref:Non-specific serine/threonine protein kinase n=1 Tax=Nocardia kruczakiae TaxID=261477 RepID=A0ABU1XCK3_9NOCA|nr:protein kinase [Nocardia kruczakiae]MDR7168273.1 non-specific serine/threonine protein kinase [Nocardia kruczakiae]